MKKNTQIFKNEIFNLVGTEYTLESEYGSFNNMKASKSPIKIKHTVCGHTYETRPETFLKGLGRCPICNNFKKTTESFKEELKEKFQNEYSVIGEYKNNKTRIKIKHNTCGNIWEPTPNALLYGNSSCPQCSRKKSTVEFKQEMFNLVGNEYSLIQDYINAETKIKIKHNTCGNIYAVRPSSFLHGNRCPKCSFKRKSNEEFQTEVFVLVGNEYSFLEPYKDSDTNILIKHNTCGYVWTARPTNFLSGKVRCPLCSKKGISKIQKEISDFIKSLGLEVENDKRFYINNHKFQELDIYIPSLRIGIEYDGFYWHSEKNNYSIKNKNYHIDKTNFFKKKSIRVIHIFEDEWKNKKEIVKTKLRHILKKSNSEKIYARDCFIKEINSKEKNEFLERYHIQGKDISTIKLGLFEKNNNVLVGVMTFGKRRISLGNTKKKGYELLRYATSKNAVGGFSKLLKYSIDTLKLDNIITYADLRWSSLNDNVYLKFFKFVHCSQPNYWYIYGSKKYHRYNFRKQILKKKFPNLYKDTLTEFQIMDKTKYLRVWDCGNAVYILNRNKE